MSLLGWLFGGDESTSTKTTTQSWSETIQKDQRVTAEEAEIIAGAGAEIRVTQPGAFALEPGAKIGKLVVQEYTPEVQKTISKLIKSVDIVSQETIPTVLESFTTLTKGLAESFGQAISETSERSEQVTELLGEKLQETQLGQAAILPGMAKYLLIAVVVIVLARKVLK